VQPLPEKKVREIEKTALRRAKLADKNKKKNQERRDEHNITGKELWLQKVIPKFEKYKKSNLVKKLCTKGIPSAVRGKAWPLLMGNQLQVTPELMEIFYNHALDFEKEDNLIRNEIEERAREQSRQNALKKTSPDLNGEEEVESSGEMKEQEQCSSTTQEKNNTKLEGAVVNATVEDTQRLGKRKSLHYINIDLPRTFPKLSFFVEGSPLCSDLKKMLMSYAFYRPDVGYIQGMSYIAAVLLLYMDVHDAFSCFANLLSTHFYFDFFRLDPEKINGHLSVYDCLLQESLPSLYQHFQMEEIESEMYMIDWLLTLYSRSMPLDIAARVWDLYLYEGEISLFKVAIGILNMHRDMLMRLDMAGILHFLHNIPDDLNEHVLFDTFVAKVDITSKHFAKMSKKVQSQLLKKKKISVRN
jgi:hypothetical protein